MKLFEEQQISKVEVKPPVVDSSTFIKNNLMRNVERSGKVYTGIQKWLHSFEGALSKATFQKQLRRLSDDDEVALKQLEVSIGKRTIPYRPTPQAPPLTRTLIEEMVEHTFVAVYGKKFKETIKKTLDELRQLGKVYVLSIEELILEFKSYKDKGKSPQMIEDAIECDFLFMVDLERPIHLERRIVEAINRIGKFRKGKPIIATWNKFNDCKEFFTQFRLFVVQ